MSAAPLNPATQTNTAQAGPGTQGVAASGGAQKGQKGPLTGFEALLATLNAAQESAAEGAAPLKGAPKIPSKTASTSAASTTGDSKADLVPADKTADESDAAAGVLASIATQLLVPTPQPTATAAAMDAAKGEAAAAVSLKAGAAPVTPGQSEAALLTAAITKSADAADTAPAPAPALDPTPLTVAKLDLPVATPLDAASTPKADLSSLVEAQPAATDPAPAAKAPPPGEPATQAAPQAPSPAAAQTPPPEAAPAAAPVAPAVAAPIAAAMNSSAVAAASAAEAGKPSVTPSSEASSRDRPAAGKTARVEGVGAATAMANGGAISAKMAEGVQSQAQADLTVADATAGETGARAAEDHVPAQADTAAPASETGPDLNLATSAAATPAVATHASAAEVRSQPQTVALLAAQIVKKLDSRSTHFDVALDPIGLGHVNVRVEIGATGKMTAAMAFDTPQAAAELRGRAAELQDAMKQAGFDVSGGLSFDVASDRGQGAPNQDNQPAPAFRGRAFQTALDTVGDAAVSQLSFRRSSASGVDIRI